MDSVELKNRTKKFAVDIINLSSTIPSTFANNIITKQLIRSATSVGANYRAALRGKSDPDFLYKINIVQEEADESIYWIELLTETNIIEINGINELKKETNELTSIFTAILKTLKSKNLKPKI